MILKGLSLINKDNPIFVLLSNQKYKLGDKMKCTCKMNPYHNTRVNIIEERFKIFHFHMKSILSISIPGKLITM